MMCVTVGETAILLVHAPEGWFALHPLCSHANLELDGGRVRNGWIMCPHHGARFELRTGRHMGEPAFTGIRVYPVRVREGQVEVMVDQ
jgi:3-phenylpropionate/trans-cinnamate dioxygenase ferredoxin component